MGDETTRVAVTSRSFSSDAQNTAAILTSFNEVDLKAVMHLRRKYKELFIERHGIKLGWTGGVNRRAAAELALAFAISLLRQVPQANRLVMAGGWQQIQGVQLSCKTVGIIGLGHVGKDLVRLLQPFDCRIMAHDIKAFPEFCEAFGVVPYELDTLLRESDVVTLHVPLDDMGMVESIHLCLFHFVLNDVFARINGEGRYAQTAQSPSA